MTSRSHAPPGVRSARALQALVVPGLLALVAARLVGVAANAAVPQGVLGVSALLLGLRWYGLPGLGLRGRRPLAAGIGLAVVGWFAFVVGRLVLVDTAALVPQPLGQRFLYLLIFESFCVHLWAFGLVFRALADWRGPMTAAASAGLLFGLVAFLLFLENYGQTVTTALYFVAWGQFYAFIRLRTGSILGGALVQAMQSLTAWGIWSPLETPVQRELHNLYIAVSAVYLLIVWRLWPAAAEDVRV